MVLRSTGHFPRPNPSLATLPNAELLTDTESLVRKLFASIDDRLAEIERLLKDSPDSKRFFELQQEWHTRKNAHEAEYQGVKDRAAEHEAVIKQIADLQERAKSLRTTIADRQTVYASFGDVETQFKDIKGHWFSLLELRASLLAERCGAVSELSGGLIRATIRRGADATRLKSKLSVLLEGTNIRGQAKKIDDLCDAIGAASDCISQWEKVTKDLDALASVDFEGTSNADVPATPTLSAADFTKQDIDRIARKLKPEDWIDLAVIDIEDVPKLEYRQREGEYPRLRSCIGRTTSNGAAARAIASSRAASFDRPTGRGLGQPSYSQRRGRYLGSQGEKTDHFFQP